MLNRALVSLRRFIVGSSEEYQPEIDVEAAEEHKSEVEMKAVSQTASREETIQAGKIISSLSSILLAKENRPGIMAASVLTLINTALNFVAPYLLGEVFDALAKKEDASIAGIEVTPVMLVLMLVTAQTLSQIIPNLRDQALVPVTTNSTKIIINQITEHQLNKSLDYHSQTPFGDQVYLLQKGFVVASTATPLLTQIAPTFFEIIMASVALSVRFGERMGAGVAGTAIFFIGYSALTTRPVIDTREVMLNAGRKAWEKITHVMKQYKNIHDFGRYEEEMSAVKKATQDFVTAEINAIIAPLKVGLGQIAIPRLGMLFAALYVAAGVQSSNYTVQEFILLVSYLDKLSTLVPSVGQALNGLFSSYPDLRFLFGELTKPSEIIDFNPDVPLELKGAPSIRFENVTFAYPKRDYGIRLAPSEPMAADDKKIGVEELCLYDNAGKLCYVTNDSTGKIYQGDILEGKEHDRLEKKHIDFLKNLLAKEPLPKDPLSVKDVSLAEGKSSLRALLALAEMRGHTPEKPPLLCDLSFTVPAGKTVAIISQTGGGKSSIFKLLYRYNTPQTGRILINEQDIAKVSLKSLQDNVGLIAQKPNLANCSIRDNIKAGAKKSADVTDQKIWELASKTHLTEFLNSFPEKLDKLAGENGDQLSGGEAQRVGILRGLLKPAPIRLFDEMTSALDNLTASQILTDVQTMTAGQTRLMITHKLIEAQGADTIIVLQNGKVADEGTHHELLTRNGLYKLLWDKQMNSDQVGELKNEEVSLLRRNILTH